MIGGPSSSALLKKDQPGGQAVPQNRHGAIEIAEGALVRNGVVHAGSPASSMTGSPVASRGSKNSRGGPAPSRSGQEADPWQAFQEWPSFQVPAARPPATERAILFFGDIGQGAGRAPRLAVHKLQLPAITLPANRGHRAARSGIHSGRRVPRRWRCREKHADWPVVGMNGCIEFLDG